MHDVQGLLSCFLQGFNLVEKREKIKVIKDGIVIEIKNKQDGHNTPHIHASYQGDNISISLIDGEILAGNLPKRNQKIAVEWFKENLDSLMEKWENKHGIIIFPDMNIKIPSSWVKQTVGSKTFTRLPRQILEFALMMLLSAPCMVYNEIYLIGTTCH